MKTIVTIILLLSVTLASQGAAGDGIEGCEGHESRFGLTDQEPKLVASVANGKKYTYGNILIM